MTRSLRTALLAVVACATSMGVAQSAVAAQDPAPSRVSADADSHLPIVVRDEQGRSHRFDRLPQRIVSLLPSLTETVWALGGAERLVGVDRFSNWPPELAHLPRLGGLEDAQVEAIAALRPDVVLASRGSRAVERLQALGITVIRMHASSIGDMRGVMEEVSRLLGQPAAAKRAWDGIESALADAARRVPDALRGQRVYFELGGGPYAAGAQSFIGETLSRLGLNNIVPAQMGPFPRLNPEFIVRARPELIMGSAREVAGMAARPGWQNLPALRDARVCGFDAAQYDVLVRPGPRIAEAAGLMADCLVRLDPAAAAANARSVRTIGVSNAR